MSSGDISLTTPKSIPNLVLAELNIAAVAPAFMTITFFEVDKTGAAHIVRIANSATNDPSAVSGFDYSGGVFTDGVARTPGNNYLTTILGVLFIGDASTLNQRKTALVTRLKTDGVITAAGTVG